MSVSASFLKEAVRGDNRLLTRRLAQRHVRLMLRVAAGVLALCAVTAGCASDPAANQVESGPLPSWVLDLSPQPGAEWSLDERIEVTYDVPSDESVRLSIDGEDVTDVAELGDGQLTYDARQAPVALELGSGEHTATVERVRTGEGGSPDEPVDSFSWTFQIP